MVTAAIQWKDHTQNILLEYKDKQNKEQVYMCWVNR